MVKCKLSYQNACFMYEKYYFWGVKMKKNYVIYCESKEEQIACSSIKQASTRYKINYRALSYNLKTYGIYYRNGIIFKKLIVLFA